MNARIQSLSKERASYLILMTFGLFVLLAGLMSEFFQAPDETNPEIQGFQKVIPQTFLSSVQKLSLENRLGRFEMAKDQEFNNWNLISPRSLPANEGQINFILKQLSELSIIDVKLKDVINLSNFSLNNPTYKIGLEDDKGESMTVAFGLVNPIDNSTYLTIEKEQAIYHVKALERTYQKVDLSDLLDSTVFHIPKNVQKITLEKNAPISPAQVFGLQKKELLWQDDKEKPFDNEKVKTFIAELSQLKSALILDERSENLNDMIENIFSKPHRILSITNSSSHEVQYKISRPFYSLADLKIEKKSWTLVQASNRVHPYIVETKALNSLNKGEKHFRPLSIKKLFY